MGSNGISSFRRGRPPHRTPRRLAGLLGLLPLLAGCETMTRMDYLDRFFEPPRVAEPAPVAEPMPPPVAAEAPPAAQPAAPEPAPEPAPETVATMEPRPNPPPRRATSQATPAAASPETEEERLRTTLRQNPWLTRFWSELTPAQRRRVEGGLRRVADTGEPAAAWDSMGLADRARLAYGRGQRRTTPGTEDGGEGAAWAGRP